jgi:two-component system CheB/CheR fusion protein
VELHRRPVALGTIIARAVEVCRPDIEVRGLHFDVDLKDPPHGVQADPARMQQVFWNLLRNSIKFTPLGGCVGIRCWREAGEVVTQVNDSGMGIEPEVLPHLFRAFEQGGTYVTPGLGGLGLGLAICKAMVELHGGTISAQSEGKGKGATFTVRLPMCDLAASDEDAQLSTGQHSPAPPATRKLQILLVEDHGDTARVMKKLLELNGHDVQTAGDRATALQRATQRSFDLLISDLGLPDGDGLELIRELRSCGHTLPAIALSGYGQEHDVEKSRAAGFAAHLIKPTDFEQLCEAIAAAVP